MKYNTQMIEYAKACLENRLAEICKGENSKIIQVTPYGGSEIIKFENGKRYKLTLSVWLPDMVTLD